MCVHIGVGFGVACSDTKAIPEPQIAEQQQCSPAFFVVFFINRKHLVFIYSKIKVKLKKENYENN